MKRHSPVVSQFGIEAAGVLGSAKVGSRKNKKRLISFRAAQIVKLGEEQERKPRMTRIRADQLEFRL